MAVGYQYQNDYSEKQNKKGYRKKLLILVGGILFLLIVAVLGMPKKTIPVVESRVSFENLPVLDSDKKTDVENKVKQNAENFLKSSGQTIFIANFLINSVENNPEYVNFSSRLDINSCEFLTTEWPAELLDNVIIAQFICSDKYFYVAASKFYKYKFFNWEVSDSADFKTLIRKIAK
jgi:hypothetical protein